VEACRRVIQVLGVEGRADDDFYLAFLISPFGKKAQADDENVLKNPRKVAYSGQQFPVESLLAFGQQFVPRLTSSDHLSMAAYASFLEHVGQCYVIGHSQGGTFAVRSALANRSFIRAVVALEPPITEECIAELECDVGGEIPPHLFVFGDYIRGANETWEAYLLNVERYCHLLRKRGTACQLLELPDIGVYGNSHMLQMDKNGNQVAGVIKDWLLSLEDLR
jgi:hypothetical protein